MLLIIVIILIINYIVQGARCNLSSALSGNDSDDEDFFNQSMLMMNPAQRMQSKLSYRLEFLLVYSQSVRRRQHACLRRKSVPSPKSTSVVAKTYISPYLARTVIFAVEGQV